MNQTDPATLREGFYRLPDEAKVDRATAAAVAFLRPQTLDVLAIKGGGPAYSRVGRRALYTKGDVVAWLEARGRRFENTAQLTTEAA